MHPLTRIPPGLLAAGLALALLSAGPVGAGEQDTPAMTHEQADAILKELQAIRGVLEHIEQQGLARPGGRPARPTSATVKIEDDEPALGRADAPVTVVEFTEFQCPFCKRFNQNTFPKLKRDYIDTGKVRWVVRDLPMSFHAQARKAGQAAHCAGEQGRYWEMREVLFGNSPKLEPEMLPRYAQVAGLDVDAFNDCLASDRHLADMDRDTKVAGNVRITGTPTFLIGKAQGNDLSGNLVIGAQADRVFTAEIDRLLAPAEADKPAQ